MDERYIARKLAAEAIARGEPLAWFDELYTMAENDGVPVPWADLEPNPNLVQYMERLGMRGEGKIALKVGCGYGDDAEYLSEMGFDVVAFDISSAAINKAKKRFPQSRVDYNVHDLFVPRNDWIQKFDLVLESYTLQVLPEDLRERCLRILPTLLNQSGHILIIARGRDSEEVGSMPWPLAREELDVLLEEDMECVDFEDYLDSENPPVRRFRALYSRTW